MNTRRQTVWLVSMLGLMVVLSAYYLFTDEADQIPVNTEQTAETEIVVEGVGMMDPTAAQQSVSIENIATIEEGEAAEGGTTTEGETAEGGTTTEGETTDGASANAESEAAETTGEAVTNEQVLEQVANQSGADAITAMQIERDSQFSKRFEELTAQMTNEEATEEQIAEAANRQNALMDLETKMIALEEKLLADYENVAVMYDEAKEHFTVHVSAAQLEKSEAVSIVTEAMKDLGIAIHQITVKLYN
ncbi:SpoIIIAH-like family protein [Paenibacillus sp.]|uniref:SpoIIIAH-like family protein n=1 Tax=Paenibacillus sp. TaxID=58172 RepID=UPI002D6F416C|nr:SpoIIIAH-like family protein [Paenibacillus sp.]HZG85121.1 SpoIIIAH-like family protein [Paenibacillus sp.]